MSSDRRDELVTNAADRKQLRRAKDKGKAKRDQERQDMRLALEHGPSRRVFWRLMFEARTGLSHATELQPHLTASVWDPSSRIHYHAGRQDMGHLLQGWIRAANPRALVEMLAAAIAADEQERIENQSARTAPATTK